MVKRASLFLFALALFFLPGGNYFLSLTAWPQKTMTRPLAINFPLAFAYPFKISAVEPPWLSAYAAVVMDKDAAVLLYGKNETAALLPASTVKIMTALVALDTYDLDRVLTVGQVSHTGQDMKLIEGEKISVANLLAGLLIASANDAALVLAKNYPGGQAGFVAAMNQKTRDLHLTASYFANPTGLDSGPEGQLLPDFSYTTALDLTRLASFALKNPVFARLIALPQLTVTDESGQIIHPLFNINELLNRIEGMKGIKTGWTEDAGECLVGLVEKNGHGLITVVLKSDDRFGETVRLLDWAFAHHQWQEITPAIEDQGR